MPNPFLTPPIDLVDAAGRSTRAGGAAWLPKLNVAARAHCAFHLFLPGMAGKRRGGDAARLYATTSAPYRRSGRLIVPAGDDFAIWWWDIDALEAHAGTRGVASMLPEPLVQAPGEGWRHLKQSVGYEAQLWRGGALRASAWRRTPFDAPAWTAFTRVNAGGEEDAPVSPPAPLVLPFAPGLSSYLLARPQLSTEQTVQLAVGGFTALCLGLSALFAGQAWKLGQLTQATQEDTARILAAAPAPTPQTIRQGLERLNGFLSLLERNDPMASLAIAVGVLQLYEITPLGFTADAEKIEVTLPYSAAAKAEELTAALEGSQAFEEITAETRGDRTSVVFSMTPRGVPALAPRKRADRPPPVVATPAL